MYSQTKKMKMVAASICIPKNDANHPSGQDAHFIATKEQCIGVADGVGGWTKDGIDSSVYANQLMLNCVESLKNGNKKRPRQVLEEAYSKTTAPGSSTACIVSFSGGGKVLRAANVGDSGFLVIRKGRVKYRSPTQQHRFNCPFQLGTKGDDPSVAQGIKLGGVKKGDLVLLATDGVFDNVHESEMLDVLAKLLPKNHRDHDHLDLEVLCRNIAKVALYNSPRYEHQYPVFDRGETGWQKWPGGKNDDITLVVARIQEEARALLN